MKRAIVFLAAVALCSAGSVFALYGVINEGTWPKSWPKELEPLRKQARTLVGPVDPQRHYAIPFSKRAAFESAWPHIVKVNSKRAPLCLRRAPNFFLGSGKAGVVVHCPPAGQAEEPMHIDLVVDGDVVDLNRIRLPADTPIRDERFKGTRQGRARPTPPAPLASAWAPSRCPWLVMLLL